VPKKKELMYGESSIASEFKEAAVSFSPFSPTEQGVYFFTKLCSYINTN